MTQRLALTVQETAEILRCSPSHVRKMCAEGQIDHRYYGKKLLVLRIPLERELGLESGALAPEASQRESEPASFCDVNGPLSPKASAAPEVHATPPAGATAGGSKTSRSLLSGATA